MLNVQRFLLLTQCVTVLACLPAYSAPAGSKPSNQISSATPEVRRNYTPLSFTRVSLADRFWSGRQDTNRVVTIPHIYQKLLGVGNITPFKWSGVGGPKTHVFWDSDLAKWMEAAGYSLAVHKDSVLDASLEEIIAGMARIQLPDGYMNSHFIWGELDKRLTNLRDNHELYCAGHLFEAAVAYYEATGKRSYLDVACRYADCLDRLFGPQGKKGYCGHEEIELALVKLYRATGEKRYLTLSQFFVDERGRQPVYYIQEAIDRGENSDQVRQRDYSYCQAHKPVREQDEVIGHAVRSMYLYSAMTDLAAETGDQELFRACERLWINLTEKRLYLTGGIGSSGSNEGFTTDYDLPNDGAYAETCAAIGLVFWNHRMLQIDCNGKYADLMERALYNGVLSGISLDGKGFFYVNPLASGGKHHRQDWFGCACCPPNIARLIAAIGEYFYSQNEDSIAVHLYAQNSAKFDLAGQTIRLDQKTDYPWNGRIKLTIGVEKPSSFKLLMRIPGWCTDARAWVNGSPVSLRKNLVRGYLAVNREWKDQDVVSLDLDMPIQRIHANPKVTPDLRTVAIQRGPLVYCLEAADNLFALSQMVLPSNAHFKLCPAKDLPDNVVAITGRAKIPDQEAWPSALYAPAAVRVKDCTFTAVPYCYWDNRKPGEMRVWLGAQ